MAVQIIDNGSGNVVEATEAFLREQAGRIILEGDGNRVTIGPGCRMRIGAVIRLYRGSAMTVGRDCDLADINVLLDRAATLIIGLEAGFSGVTNIRSPEGSSIHIGQGSLVATQTHIFASDMHPVVEVATGRRVNPPADVRIGDHVWIGTLSVVCKGSDIGAGSIVGACSLITGTFGENLALGGNPARVLRAGVTWHHEFADLEPREDILAQAGAVVEHAACRPVVAQAVAADRGAPEPHTF
jgi:carbonic anhydrase/acetyltransferase-like protein (isoleucine patch superfamily)